MRGKPVEHESVSFEDIDPSNPDPNAQILLDQADVRADLHHGFNKLGKSDRKLLSKIPNEDPNRSEIEAIGKEYGIQHAATSARIRTALINLKNVLKDRD